MNEFEKTFPDVNGLVPDWQKRRRPLVYSEGESLPPLDVDLDALQNSFIPTEIPELGDEARSYSRRVVSLQRELSGCTELAYLNAMLIVNLRKREFPAHAPDLFFRLWKEKGDILMRELTGRWMISSMITFGDHGPTEEDRRLGMTMNMLFSLMKLYEAERLYSGKRGDEVFDPERRVAADLPMGMPSFSLQDGDLVVNLLAPLEYHARRAPNAGPLGRQLLRLLNHDDSNIFRRLSKMREMVKGDNLQENSPSD